MRVVRRASLIFSLTLIVAIAVGYVARRSEMSSARDQGLTAAAEIGSSRMSAIVDAVEIAASSGHDAAPTVNALTAAHPELGVCVVDAETISCGGDGPRPSNDVVEQRLADRQELDGATGGAEVDTYESLISIDADGPSVSVIAQLPTDAISGRGDIVVWATTFLPDRDRGQRLRRRARDPTDGNRGHIGARSLRGCRHRGRRPSPQRRAPVLHADLHPRRDPARARRRHPARRAAHASSNAPASTRSPSCPTAASSSVAPST